MGGYGGDVKNGFVRNGKGKEMDGNGNVIYTGDWKNGKRNGSGKEMDASGRIVFVGEWMNGKGKGKEMDENGKAVYEGEWWNEKRNGSGKEMDASGRVVFVGEWKNGKGKGKEMDADGKAVYEGEWWNGKRNGMGEVLKGTRWVGHWKDGKMNGMGYEKDENGVMKRGCLFENGVMKRVVQEFNGGKMVEYDENGRKVYEGEYKGSVEKGFVRNGEGKEMDASGVVLFVGEWKEGKRKEKEVDGVSYLMIPSSLTSNPQGIEELKIGNNGYNDDSVTELKLSWLVRLKRIVIGNECFGKVRVFELDGLDELESVEIGQKSFRISGDKRSDGSYRIVNCPKLKSIQIGQYSFRDYHSFELNNLPSLQSIDIGDWCFSYAPSFSLTGLIDGLV